MAKTIPGRYCHREKLPDDVGLIFQTHFHNNNLPNLLPSSLYVNVHFEQVFNPEIGIHAQLIKIFL